MTEAMMIKVPGPFSLLITFTLTKDGCEDVGNLLSDASREYKRSFDTLDEAMQWLQSKVGGVDA